MKKLYFAYGANLHVDNMQYRCPSAKKVKAFYLKDWRLTFSIHATIEPALGKTVAGALWEITDECEQALDFYEGFPTYYTKQILEQDGIEFMAYIMTPSKPAKPSPEYLNVIKGGYQNWGLDTSYLKQAL